jgi:membrane protein required for colicin V production
MTWIDWAIVVVLASSVIGGISQGFFRSVCSLLGLFLGLAIASWNYGRAASFLLPILRSEALADAFGFLLIAFLVMTIAHIVGAVLSKTLHHMGLGCLDRIAGGAFGFLQGALLITIVILAIVAFYPQAHWLAEARLPKLFFGVCHFSTHVTPKDLAERVHHGLVMMEENTPEWMHPTGG